MNNACTFDIRALETQLHLDASSAERLDTLLPVESSSKPTGLFASDCCGSNNYNAN